MPSCAVHMVGVRRDLFALSYHATDHARATWSSAPVLLVPPLAAIPDRRCRCSVRGRRHSHSHCYRARLPNMTRAQRRDPCPPTLDGGAPTHPRAAVWACARKHPCSVVGVGRAPRPGAPTRLASAASAPRDAIFPTERNARAPEWATWTLRRDRPATAPAPESGSTMRGSRATARRRPVW